MRNLANKRKGYEGGGNNTIISSWIDANLKYWNDQFCIYVHKDCLDDDFNYFYNEPFGSVTKKDYLVIFCAVVDGNNNVIEPKNALDRDEIEWRDKSKIFCKYIYEKDYLLDPSTKMTEIVTVEEIWGIKHNDMLPFRKIGGVLNGIITKINIYITNFK